jgi:hypothetical protein
MMTTTFFCAMISRRSDVLAQRRLRDAKMFSGTRETSAACDLDEVP